MVFFTRRAQNYGNVAELLADQVANQPQGKQTGQLAGQLADQPLVHPAVELASCRGGQDHLGSPMLHRRTGDEREWHTSSHENRTGRQNWPP